ncbi:MAG: rhomboid family intramembrane serine protease [Prolixibacteraceae bacterium]|nr:rhomboid family intramembrane serine protease [Prolixibacteraceae bacterium]
MKIFNYYPHDTSLDDKELEKKIFRHSLLFPSIFIALFWLVKLVESGFDLSFVQFGIYPLNFNGLPGIILSPFIHSGYSHLISNSIPFFILLFALVYFYRKYAYRIFFLIFLMSGICVWLAGREAWHIGASGVVYGLAAFHFTSGVIRNDVRLLTLAVVVVFLYGSMVWGMMPIDPKISWESHLWGAVSGVLLAVYYRKYNIRRKQFDWENELEEETTETEVEQQVTPENSTSTSMQSSESISFYSSSTALEYEENLKEP